jgi:hypothetical protein
MRRRKIISFEKSALKHMLKDVLQIKFSNKFKCVTPETASVV